jgi:hypothetical protein
MVTDVGTNASVVLALTLMVAAAAWPAAAPYGFAAALVLCAIAVIATLEAVQVDRKVCALGLGAIAVFFNPFLSVGLSRRLALTASLGALGGLIAWLVMLERTVPPESIAQVLHPPDVTR